MYVYIYILKKGLVGSRVKANCLFVGPGPVGKVPSVGGREKN